MSSPGHTATDFPKRILKGTYLILKRLKYDERGSVYLALYFRNFWRLEKCVIKEGEASTNVDIYGRGMKDRIEWQSHLHKRFTGLIPIPSYIDSFEENDRHYLVIEYKKGVDFFEWINTKHESVHWAYVSTSNKKEILQALHTIISIVKTIHSEGYVHRDLSATNFLMDKHNQVIPIDLELSYSKRDAYPTPPFTFGTPGYISPQQEGGVVLPDYPDDIYALSGLIIFAITGTEPSFIIERNRTNLFNKLFYLSNSRELSELIISGIDPIPEGRPSITHIEQVLTDFERTIGSSTPALFSSYPPNYIVAGLSEVIQHGIDGISNPMLMEEFLWTSDLLPDDRTKESGELDRGIYYNLNVGVSGVLYFLAKAKHAGYDISRALPAIANSIEYIQTVGSDPEVKTTGYHFGKTGISVALCYAVRAGFVEPTTDMLAIMEVCFSGKPAVLNMINGVAGEGVAILQCRDTLNQQKMDELLRDKVRELLAAQNKEGSWDSAVLLGGKVWPEMQTGFAYGAAGIIFFLLEYWRIYQDSSVKSAAIKGLAWLMKVRRLRNGALYWPISNLRKEEVKGWGEGSTGIALVFIKAFEVLGDASYREVAEGALRVRPAAIISSNLSQCYGLSGLGEVYLEAYRVFGDKSWYDRATWIATLIVNRRMENENSEVFWLAHTKEYPSANLFLGAGGVLHFLLRYSDPDSYCYPLLDTRFFESATYLDVKVNVKEKQIMK